MMEEALWLVGKYIFLLGSMMYAIYDCCRERKKK